MNYFSAFTKLELNYFLWYHIDLISRKKLVFRKHLCIKRKASLNDILMHGLIWLISWYAAKLQMKSSNTGSDWASILPGTLFILSQTTVRVTFMESEWKTTCFSLFTSQLWHGKGENLVLPSLWLSWVGNSTRVGKFPLWLPSAALKVVG